LFFFNSDSAGRHPHSVDALCALPSNYPSSQNTILTGSSDGLLRVIELLPTHLVGVIADHGDFPIERIAIDRAGEGRWVGSVGHDEALRLTDLREVLEDEEERDARSEDEDGEGGASSDEEGEGAHSGLLPLAKSETVDEDGGDGGGEHDSGDESDAPKPRKRRKKDKGDLKGRPQKKGRKHVDVDPSFFMGL
jgi:hypothetical protein